MLPPDAAPLPPSAGRLGACHPCRLGPWLVPDPNPPLDSTAGDVKFRFGLPPFWVVHRWRAMAAAATPAPGGVVNLANLLGWRVLALITTGDSMGQYDWLL